MIRRFTALTVVAAFWMAALVVAAPAYAQMGSFTGKVVDEAGKPVPDAEVALDFTGEQNIHFTVKTDKNSNWTRAGLIAVGGKWTVTAKKGNLAGALAPVLAGIGGAMALPDIVLRAGGGGAATSADAKKNSEAKKVLEEANAALAANDYDLAISKLTEATTKVDKCTECFLRLGDVYAKKADYEKAEASFKQALTLDEKSADAYDGLAIIYNTQKKFDEAGKASTKSGELRAAGGGPVDPNAAYNAGVIFWNQGKIPEAKAQFAKAIQANPNMAEAQYYYGMCLVNEGKVAEAKTALEAYLKLAPTGPNAPTAKSILDSLK